jgi:ubiquinone/menaquinone biosynthesis C-methylase UbiE
VENQELKPNEFNPWNDIFKTQGRVFNEPQSDMPAIVKLLKERKAKTVLDLGSGTGRHSVYLAKNGFTVYGLDSSPEGLQATQKWLSAEGLTAELHLGNMTAGLPYPDAFFDGLICIRVMHHGDSATVQKIAREITRVIKSGGILFVTVATSRKIANTWEEIEPNSLMPLDGPEKGLIHHFFTPQEMKEVFSGFEVADIHLDEIKCYAMTAIKK